MTQCCKASCWPFFDEHNIAKMTALAGFGSVVTGMDVVRTARVLFGVWRMLTDVCGGWFAFHGGC
jgi:hypothetical protein